MLSDLAVAHAHDIDSLELNFATRRRRAQEFSPVGPVIGLVRCHAVAIGDLPMDVGVKVGKAARSTRYNSLAPALSGVRPGCGVWSRKSSAKSSSNTSKFPPPCTSSVLRRTTAFAASLELLIVMPYPIGLRFLFGNHLSLALKVYQVEEYPSRMRTLVTQMAAPEACPIERRAQLRATLAPYPRLAKEPT
jgi:hypothetical protein